MCFKKHIFQKFATLHFVIDYNLPKLLKNGNSLKFSGENIIDEGFFAVLSKFYNENLKFNTPVFSRWKENVITLKAKINFCEFLFKKFPSKKFLIAE